MEKQRKIALRSEEIQEIIERIPPWTTRWGSFLIFALISFFLSLSFLVRYPDTLDGQALVTTLEPPVRIRTLQGGQLLRLNVHDGQYVEQGAVIAELKQPFSISDLQLVSRFVGEVEQSIRNSELPLPEFPENIVLGALQPEWNELLVNLREFKNRRQTDVLKKRTQFIQNELKLRREALEVARAKLALLRRDETRLKQRLEGSGRLYSENAISKDEFNTDEQRLEAAELVVKDARERIVQDEIQVNELQSALFELEFGNTEAIRKLESAIMAAILKFRALARTWEQENVIRSPVNGVLSIPNRLVKNQYYEPGSELVAVLPQSISFEAIIQIEAHGAGKVRKGQQVRISLAGFPEHEFGTLEGVVRKIAAVPSEQKYEVTVDLPSGLRTAYGLEIPPKAEMQGTAVIITEKRRLIDRFFGNLKKLVR